MRTGDLSLVYKRGVMVAQTSYEEVLPLLGRQAIEALARSWQEDNPLG